MHTGSKNNSGNINEKTLKQELVHPKDPVPVSKRKGVICSIPCAECPRTYIRKTGSRPDFVPWPPSTQWVEALPMVLLGLRSSVKEDLGCCIAEVVYRTTLHNPDEFPIKLRRSQILSSTFPTSTP